jgi:tripartite-type tricarboxylate transporter receptor subunit TctC
MIECERAKLARGRRPCLAQHDSRSDVLAEQFAQAGLEAISTTPDAFAAEIRESMARWPRVVKSLGLRAQ